MALAVRTNGVAAPPPALPFVLCWGQPASPLPLRPVHLPARAVRLVGTDAPPWLATGPLGRPFDFCGHVRRLCQDIAARCDTFRHIDVSRILFAVTQSRNGRSHGLQARVTPLRFRDGALRRRHGSVVYQVQRYFHGPVEFLYLVTFCLPRFLDQNFDDKFITLFHELFHISPAFNGDLRRLGGRYDIHSRSQRAYDQYMAKLAREYLAGKPDADLHAFLRLDFAQLVHRHGSVRGIVVPRPKVLTISG